MKIVSVPDLTHPTMCYVQCLEGPNTMARCGFAKGHLGPHAWEATNTWPLPEVAPDRPSQHAPRDSERDA